MSAKNFKRSCPICNKTIFYSKKHNCAAAENRKSECRSCQAKRKVGVKNPFYGKTHSQETKNIISHFNSEVRVLSNDFLKQAKVNLSKVTNKRPLYNIWLEKYGKEIADQKLQLFKNKQSLNQSGINNPMYGKPSPQGSGNGWSGWYKNWYFRSLRELSYMIKVLEDQGLTWEIPDKNFKIPYIDYTGQSRTYFPDFIVDNKIIEIKPYKLHNTPKVLAKKKAAEDFCKSKNMNYELIDPILLSEEEIKLLYLSGQIKFLDKYDLKFKEKYLKC